MGVSESTGGVVFFFSQFVHFASGVVGCAALGFPTVRYLRICRIFSAVAGPIPGTVSSSLDVAVLMFTGFGGGFLVVPAAAQTKRHNKAAETKTGSVR